MRAALRDRDLRQTVASALRRLGPAAVEFAPDLATPYEDGPVGYRLPSPEALAAVGREDRATVLRLMEFVRSDRGHVGHDAATVLSDIGPQAARLVPSLPGELPALSIDPARDTLALRCLAAVSPDRRGAFDRVADAARPAPPDMRKVEGFGDYAYDATMHRRGVAISALGHFAAFADEAVPILVDALDTFEEYDPDWGYENGEYGRVIDALSRLGPAAAAALPALLRRLRDSNGDVDRRVVRFFGQLGPAAAEALPALEQLDAETRDDLLYPGTPEEPPVEYLDPVGWAIARIKGRL